MANTRELSQLASLLVVQDSTRNIGIGTTDPISKLHVIGDVTATSFFGDGSALTGIVGSGGGVELTDFSATTPIVYNNTTGALSHAESGVGGGFSVGGLSGSVISVPVITTNSTGHITNITSETYASPINIVTGFYFNNQSYLVDDTIGRIGFVAGDNVTLSASPSGPGGYPTLTISSTGGGGATDWYNAVNTTSPDTTLNKPAAYDGDAFGMATRLAIGGNDSAFPSGSSPTPGFWTSNPNSFGGDTYTESSSSDSSFTVSSGTPGVRWIIAANTTGYSSGIVNFSSSTSSGSFVNYSNGLSSLPSTSDTAAEVHGVVVCDSGSVLVTDSPNCTVHETLSANNITYIFWSMTKAQSDNVFNGSDMLILSTFTSFFVNYFYKNSL